MSDRNMPARPKTPSPVDVQVGARIRLQRVFLGMSQMDLGRELGITFQQVQKYERDTNRVSASRFQEIAEVLGKNVPYFFEGMSATGTPEHGKDTGSAAFLNLLQTPESMALNRAFQRIENVKVRRKVVALVAALAGDSEDGPDRHA